MNHAIQEAALTKTVFCIALEGAGPTGVNWYPTAEARDAAKGSTGARKEVAFDLNVPSDATREQINLLTDDAAWSKAYLQTRKVRIVDRIRAAHWANQDAERARARRERGLQPSTGEIPGVMQYLDLCTSHVSAETMKWLEAAPTTGAHCLGLTIAPYEYGVFVSVPSDVQEESAIDSLDCAADLKVVLNYARAINCALLRFDRDAAATDALPVFDW